MKPKPSFFCKLRRWSRGGNLGVLKRFSREAQRQRLIEQGFKDSDPNVISKLSDKELATFQSQHSERSRQFIIADYEWQRRLTVRQVRATTHAAWIGVLSTLSGVILGYMLKR